VVARTVSVCLLVGLALIGCGDSGGSGAETTALPAASNPSTRPGEPRGVQGGSGQFTGQSGARKFQALANAICGTVQAQAPASLPPSRKTTELRRYTAEAAAANRRAIVALRRLSAPSSLRVPLGRLLNSLRELQSVYAQAGSAQPNRGDAGPSTQAIRLAEDRASSNALASRVPACAPRSGGVGTPQQRRGQPETAVPSIGNGTGSR